jgi:excisionase family DNA binding protein
MTMNTAARYIDRSVPALRTLVARGMIPSHKVNGLRVFGRHEIDEWVRSGGSTLPLLGYRTRPR